MYCTIKMKYIYSDVEYISLPLEYISRAPFGSLELNILQTGKLLKVKYCIFHYKFSLHSNENWISRLKTDLKINPQISSSRDFSLQLVTQDLKISYWAH